MACSDRIMVDVINEKGEPCRIPKFRVEFYLEHHGYTLPKQTKKKTPDPAPKDPPADKAGE